MWSCLLVPVPFFLFNASCTFLLTLSHMCFILLSRMPTLSFSPSISSSFSLTWTCSSSHTCSFLQMVTIFLMVTPPSHDLILWLSFLNLFHAHMCFLNPLSCYFASFLVTLFSLFIIHSPYCTHFLFLLSCFCFLHTLIHMLSFPFSFFLLLFPFPFPLPSLPLLSLLLSLFQSSFLSCTCSLFLPWWYAYSMSCALAILTSLVTLCLFLHTHAWICAQAFSCALSLLLCHLYLFPTHCLFLSPSWVFSFLKALSLPLYSFSI